MSHSCLLTPEAFYPSVTTTPKSRIKRYTVRNSLSVRLRLLVTGIMRIRDQRNRHYILEFT